MFFDNYTLAPLFYTVHIFYNINTTGGDANPYLLLHCKRYRRSFSGQYSAEYSSWKRTTSNVTDDWWTTLQKNQTPLIRCTRGSFERYTAREPLYAFVIIDLLRNFDLYLRFVLFLVFSFFCITEKSRRNFKTNSSPNKLIISLHHRRRQLNSTRTINRCSVQKINATFLTQSDHRDCLFFFFLNTVSHFFIPLFLTLHWFLVFFFYS